MHVIGTALTRRFTRTATAMASATAAAAVIALSGAAAPLVNASPLVQSPAFDSRLEEASLYIDALGRPTPLAVEKTNQFADQPFVPPQVADALRTGIDFLAGSPETSGADLPQNGPPFAQFLWPTVSRDCIGEGWDSTASAIAVPGPAELPEPGSGPGQTAFVFTAMGTPAAAPDQGAMSVYWINLDSFRTGVTPLENIGMNPEGPATISGKADTGHGRILAVVNGGIRTTDKLCSFGPTAARFSVK